MATLKLPGSINDDNMEALQLPDEGMRALADAREYVHVAPVTNSRTDVSALNIILKASDGQIDASSLDLGKDIEVNVSTYYTGNVYVSSANIIDPEHSDAKLQLMRLEYDSNGLLTHITPNVSNALLSLIFFKVCLKLI
ncbi:MAG: hypothetical protein R3A13_02870 [Bdellovibrionota bacterium]